MGGEPGGGLEDAREEGGLVQGQLRRGHAEIAPGRGLETVVPAAEVDRVQVHFQYLIFAVDPFQLHRQNGLVHLPG